MTDPRGRFARGWAHPVPCHGALVLRPLHRRRCADLIERICEIVAMQTGGDTLHFEMNAQLLQGASHCDDVGRIKIFFFDNEGVTNP